VKKKYKGRVEHRLDNEKGNRQQNQNNMITWKLQNKLEDIELADDTNRKEKPYAEETGGRGPKNRVENKCQENQHSEK
jgi:hypothetical protein